MKPENVLIPGLKIWEELWATFPELRDEFKDVKMLFYFATSASSLHTNNKEVRVPDDVKGMKIVVPPGGAEAEALPLRERRMIPDRSR